MPRSPKGVSTPSPKGVSTPSPKGVTPPVAKGAAPNRYQAIIELIFSTHHQAGVTAFEFTRDEFVDAALAMKLVLPKNIGDVLYSVRYRTELPQTIRDAAEPGREWIIEGAGRGRYRFRQVALNRIVPRDDLVSIKIPDATPEIIGAYALGDEQALLAKVRYNRLIDVFLGITSYSLQNHLRTTVAGVGRSRSMKSTWVLIAMVGSSWCRFRPRAGATGTAWCRPSKTWRAAQASSRACCVDRCLLSSWQAAASRCSS